MQHRTYQWVKRSKRTYGRLIKLGVILNVLKRTFTCLDRNLFLAATNLAVVHTKQQQHCQPRDRT